MLKMDYKLWIKESVDLKIEEYSEWMGIKPFWDHVIIEYTSADDEGYMKLFESHTCKHPKALYSPGKTVITHFTPISKDLVKQHNEGKISEEDWDKMCRDTRQMSRGITDAIILTLQGFGREVALLSEREGWCNLSGAEMAGLGKFENRDQVFYSDDMVGGLGNVVTEVIID